MNSESPGGSDEHLPAGDLAQSSEDYAELCLAMSLLSHLLCRASSTTWETTFSNDLAARSCLTMAFRSLQVSEMLLMVGYYPEVGPQLRAAYEHASLASLLAKDPELAETWMKKGEWFPNRKVRRGIREMRGWSDEDDAPFQDHYRYQSAVTHPTAASVARVIDRDDQGPRLMLGPQFDVDTWVITCRQILATAVFVCFAARNSAVDEQALDPDWLSELYELARRFSGEPMSHLNRDFDELRLSWQELTARIADVTQLEDALKKHPGSWRNVRPDGDGPSQQA